MREGRKQLLQYEKRQSKGTSGCLELVKKPQRHDDQVRWEKSIKNYLIDIYKRSEQKKVITHTHTRQHDKQ